MEWHVNHGAAREARRNFDDVEEAAAAHVNRERYVRIEFRTASVLLLVTLCRDAALFVHRPLLYTPCRILQLLVVANNNWPNNDNGKL